MLHTPLRVMAVQKSFTEVTQTATVGRRESHQHCRDLLQGQPVRGKGVGGELQLGRGKVAQHPAAETGSEPTYHHRRRQTDQHDACPDLGVLLPVASRTISDSKPEVAVACTEHGND